MPSAIVGCETSGHPRFEGQQAVLAGDLGQADQFFDQARQVFGSVEEELHHDLGKAQENLQRHADQHDAQAAAKYHDGRRRIDELPQRDAVTAAVAAGQQQCRQQQHETADQSAECCQIHVHSLFSRRAV